MMWDTVKLLACAALVLLFAVPIAGLLGKLVAIGMDLVFKWKMKSAEHSAMLAETRATQIHVFRRDEQGFVGTVYDDRDKQFADVDEGDEWKVGERRQRSERIDTTDRQRLLAATDTVRVREPGPPLSEAEEPPFEQPWSGTPVPAQEGRDEVEV